MILPQEQSQAYAAARMPESGLFQSMYYQNSMHQSGFQNMSELSICNVSPFRLYENGSISQIDGQL